MNSLKDKIAKRKNKLKINKRDIIKWKQENIEKEKETNMEVKNHLINSKNYDEHS